jgi:hypothetical protein
MILRKQLLLPEVSTEKSSSTTEHMIDNGKTLKRIEDSNDNRILLCIPAIIFNAIRMKEFINDSIIQKTCFGW